MTNSKENLILTSYLHWHPTVQPQHWLQYCCRLHWALRIPESCSLWWVCTPHFPLLQPHLESWWVLFSHTEKENKKIAKWWTSEFFVSHINVNTFFQLYIICFNNLWKKGGREKMRVRDSEAGCETRTTKRWRKMR